MNNTLQHLKVKHLLDLTLKRIDGAYAESSIRVYRIAFTKFIIYCELSKLNALPASPETVANYIDKLSDQGSRSASIRQIVTAIATIHILNHYPNPVSDPEVKLAIKRMHRKIGRHSRQANAITRDILEALLDVTENSLRGIRDRALLLVAYDTMCRRGELGNIEVDQIDFAKQDWRGKQTSPVILVSRSKTDQEASGKWIPISMEAASALRTWLIASKVFNGKVFRGVKRNDQITNGLDAGQIGRIYKKLAKRANLDKEFIKHLSGHSMRVGAAQDMLLSGASLPIMMARGRWTKPDTVMRYVEKIGIPV